jgi:hypothetical protein
MPRSGALCKGVQVMPVVIEMAGVINEIETIGVNYPNRLNCKQYNPE